MYTGVFPGELSEKEESEDTLRRFVPLGRAGGEDWTSTEFVDETRGRDCERWRDLVEGEALSVREDCTASAFSLPLPTFRFEVDTAGGEGGSGEEG